MTVTESPEPITGPAIARALRHIGNHGPGFPCCVCGRCRAGGVYSDNELALDECVTHMLDMVCIIESSTRKAQPSAWMSLRALHDLLANARMLLCAQRQTMRALTSSRAGRGCVSAMG